VAALESVAVVVVPVVFELEMSLLFQVGTPFYIDQ
jgi:hypothetical protein